MAQDNREREIENREWIDSLNWIIENDSPERAEELLQLLQETAAGQGVSRESRERLITDYINTIAVSKQEDYPGDPEIEKKISNVIRWNAMAMVAKANKNFSGIGGHISTYSSAAHLYEVGLHHFFHSYENGLPDAIYFQGHASPGLYARSFVERRFDEENLEFFRREVQNEKGLSSYPHPRLMPEYWRYPTVSMGLGAIQAIYKARFLKYMQNRGLGDEGIDRQRIWCFLGDGEMDEPESKGAITIAAREKLSNLVFVINCNLQRLDGPVRGNSKIVDELESVFGGSGWKVIKVMWGSGWDKLFEKDSDGRLKKKFAQMPDGELQRMAQMDGKRLKEEFFTGDLAGLTEGLDEEDLKSLIRGGHDPVKIYNAYKQAAENDDGPTVILAHTVKGFQQGKAGEASNVTHQTKKFNLDQLKAFRDAMQMDFSDDDLENIPFYRFEEGSEEYQYLKEKRDKLGGWFPMRKVLAKDFKAPDDKAFKEFFSGSEGKEVATTGVMVKIMTNLLKDKNVKDMIVPVVPDESRTLGIDSLFRNYGIYAWDGQKYEPVDKQSLLFYNESKEGVILEEGITEAGSMATFIAAGTHHTTNPRYCIPFYIYYSMFGFQRVGDLIWAASDARAKGFLIGGISGRTSLSGEGLQHTDGQSHLFAMAFPNVMAYDPAFAFEVALIVRDGIKRMYTGNEDLIYYITVSNQTYKMPAMPKGVEGDVLKGLYRFSKSKTRKNKDRKVNLLGSGAIMQEVLKAAEMLEEIDIPADVWSVTSYKALYDNARNVERTNLLQEREEECFLQQKLKDEGELFVAASDYVKMLPLSLAKWFPGELIALGTDGFGRSDTEKVLRNFFEVDARYIAYHALLGLAKAGKVEKSELKDFIKENEIKPDKENPAEYL